ncbi:hypothetical protein DFR50_15735 [Roseiarcus fermentans]|uniref:Anti-sigma factor NepR domain-containing protein n=2 Tax=Roseiarcus fermentans TaxID=1473586 RepID=A0A366EG17_9HYPH|nr:hypothetical protein DFR50_15735 [Roseiarcus fermentans]
MSHSNSRANGLSEDPQLDNKVLDAIGRALKAHYDDLVRAPLPDKFLDLLADLDTEERIARSAGGHDATR